MIDTVYIALICMVLLYFEMIVFNIDYTAPTFLVTASFTLCLLCTSVIGHFYPGHNWDITELHIETGFLIVVYILIFIVEDRFCNRLAKKNITNTIKKEYMALRIQDSILYISVVLGLIALLWGIFNFKRYLTSDWISSMAAYKLDVNSGAIKENLSSKLLNQLVKILEALNHVIVFYYLNNKASKVDNPKQNKLCITSVLLYMVGRMIISGGRQRLIFVIVAAVTGMLISKTYAEGKKIIKKEKKKYFRLMLIIITILLPLFYFMGRFVGRHESEVFYAMIAYLSTGIYGLEQVVGQDFSATYWGQYSFPGFLNLFKLLGIAPEHADTTAVLDYQVFKHGNTLTMMGRWYWDFGIVGTSVMAICTAMFFSYIYYKCIKYSNPSHKRNIYIVVYIFLAHILYFAGYDDFVQTLLGFYYFQIVVLIYLIYNLIIKRKIVWRR